MLSEWLPIIGWTLFAGMTMPLGAAIASAERIRPGWLRNEFRHSVMAFGGGALVAAIALVLVPEGTKGQSPWLAGLYFAAGGLAFMGLDIWLASRKTQASQLAAMLSDFLPEALALGSQLAEGNRHGPLLAGLIALQNLPEGFNAYRELSKSSSYRSRQIIGAFTGMTLLGPLAGLLGFYWLSQCPAAVSAIMLFAAGGILYVVFQDIAPQVPLQRHWAPPLGAVAGFLVGMLGDMLVGS